MGKGADLVQIHRTRISDVERRRNQRFQRNLFSLMKDWKYEQETPTSTIGNERLDPDSQGETSKPMRITPVTERVQAAATSRSEIAKHHIDLIQGRIIEREKQRKRRARMPLVKASRKNYLKLKVYFTPEDTKLLEVISKARGEKPQDFVQTATLKMFAELGIVDEERKRFLITQMTPFSAMVEAARMKDPAGHR